MESRHGRLSSYHLERDDFEHFFLYAGQITKLGIDWRSTTALSIEASTLAYITTSRNWKIWTPTMSFPQEISWHMNINLRSSASSRWSQVWSSRRLIPKTSENTFLKRWVHFYLFVGSKLRFLCGSQPPDRRPMGVWHRVESSLLSPSSDSNNCEYSEVSQDHIYIKGYHKSLKERFHNLRYSLNPSHRAYYYEVKRRQHSSAASASRKVKTRREVLLGARREVKSYRCQTVPGLYTTRHCIFIGSFCLWLPNSSAGSLSGQVYFKTEVSNGQAHHSPYAMKATPGDPAIRLGTQICGTNTLGNAISFWLQSRGTRNVLKMNTLVDELEGKTDEEIERTPRRWIAKNETRGNSNPSYR